VPEKEWNNGFFVPAGGVKVDRHEDGRQRTEANALDPTALTFGRIRFNRIHGWDVHSEFQDMRVTPDAYITLWRRRERFPLRAN
jgi:hypothetical protein